MRVPERPPTRLDSCDAGESEREDDRDDCDRDNDPYDTSPAGLPLPLRRLAFHPNEGVLRLVRERRRDLVRRHPLSMGAN